MELLASLAPGPLNPAVGARIVAETGGNPLALMEVARELSPAQLAGAEALPEPLPVGGSLEKAFGHRVSRLPADARLLLAVAAAEPTASQALVWRAAGQLGIDPDAAAAADLGGLAEIGSQVEFRHPLIRSAVYYAIPVRQRRLIHRALAAVGDEAEPDRVAWHLGMAAAGPDEAVAARLEQAAGRARDRGGYAATVTFLSRAAELSAGEDQRAERLLAAAEAALIAGQPVRAGVMLEEATPLLGDRLARAQVRRLQGTIRFALGQAGEAPAILLEAARALAPFDARGARQSLLEAFDAALFVGWSASRAVLAEIARAARDIPTSGGSEASGVGLLLDGFAMRAAAGYPAAVPLLRCAIAMLRADDLSPVDGLRGLRLGCVAADELFDDQAQHELAIRWVQLARDQGALTALPVALNNLGACEVSAGRFDAARACFAERLEISAATGNPGVVGTAGMAEVYELAWRGHETDARRVAATVAREATGGGRSAQSVWVQYCLGVLELGLGNYQAALQCVLSVLQDDAPFSALVLPDLVEAAARGGQTGIAEAALGRLAERAAAAGHRWRSGCWPGPGRCSPATPAPSLSISRPSGTWGSAGPYRSWPAPTWSTGNGCAASAAAATPAGSCAPRMRCSPRWAPGPSPSGPASSCWPPGNAPASGPPRPKPSSPRKKPRSPSWSAKAKATGTSPRSCSSAPPPSTTTCARSTGRPA